MKHKLSVAESVKVVDQQTARRQELIQRLAEYLVQDQARKSIELSMGKPSAEEWARVRSASPLLGYPTVDEAFNQLCEFFGVSHFRSQRE